MRWIKSALVCALLIFGTAYAQGDRGTITGTVSDAAGAMVPNAPIEAKNTETGAVYQAATSATGNYTLAQLPAGIYQLTAAVPGFKQYVRTGLTVMAAQILRIDIRLEVGNITETVTVSADAPLLKTESGELSHNVSTERLNDLPILSALGMRDPFTAVNLMPGTGGTTGSMRVNGMPGYTMSLRIDGQDATQNIWTLAYGMSIPSVDSVEETAVQTSNYAAEYGQAGGGILNMTMRSGTNQLHGSAFEYFRNEALNSKPPYKNSSAYEKPRDRQHDFGFNVGGPIYLPKMYDGRDKSFFFYSFEQNRNKTTSNANYTMPTLEYRNGDFSNPALWTKNPLTQVCYDTGNPATCGIDPAGRPLLDGTIYDPATTHTVVSAINGKSYVVRDPFPGNKIPAGYPLDPVAVEYQTHVPNPTDNSKVTDNYYVTWPNQYSTTINSFKLDHSLSAKTKISGYYSLNQVKLPFADGLEPPITGTRNFRETTHTIRLNFDYTVTPTMLLHLGAGMMHFIFKDPQPNINYDNEAELGLPGTYATIPPSFQGLSQTQGGGMMATGTVSQSNTWQIKPTANFNLNWVRGNHTIKFGGEARFESHPTNVITPANGAFYFNRAQTSQPYLGTEYLTGGSLGFPYASFLLGMINNGEIGIPNRFHLGKQAWGFFAQDSWKVTPKLTLDYGLRWDYQTYLRETYGRVPSFGPDVPNPSYGNLPGSAVFEIDGRKFAENYPHGWGPRIGMAYQFMPKTVLRAGAGISYGQTAALEMWNLRMGSFVRYGPNPSFGYPIGLLQDGPNVNGTPVVPVWPNYDPGQAPVAAGSDFMPWINNGAGRPPRQFQWSIGIQRELTQNISVDVSYVGNRGVWWNSNGGITDPNHVTPAILAAHNFNLSNQDDRTLLLSPLSSISSADAAAHNLTVPFTGFSGTVTQSIRPFPHVGNIYAIWAPLGNTWYDSLQLKLTKRFSHGLDFTVAYSWQKELTVGAETFDTAFEAAMPAVNKIDDLRSNKTISGLSIPHRLVIGANYLVPAWNVNKFVSWALKDWQIGAVVTYQSGGLIMAPKAVSNQAIGALMSLCAPMGVLNGCNGSLFQKNFPASYAFRVAGEDPFLVDPNGPINPFTQFVLNPKAWVSPPDGQYGGSPYYNDYRYRRRPSENMSLGRLFRFKEEMTLSLRVELMNVFNRTQVPGPSNEFTSSDATSPQISVGGQAIWGFGYIMNPLDTTGQRTGQIVMRFNF